MGKVKSDESPRTVVVCFLEKITNRTYESTRHKGKG